jgi:DNA end-binding protein Ku
VASMTASGSQEPAGFFRGLGLHAPFLHAGHVQGGMEQLRLLLGSGSWHGASRRIRRDETVCRHDGKNREDGRNARALTSLNRAPVKLSLVSCPIALFPATSEREKISFHQLNKSTGHRIKYRKVDSDTGDDVEAADIIKGYEVGKGQYVELNPEELEAVAIESKRTIEIDKFVPRDEIDEIFFNSPYYIIPDGEVGAQAFAVIREAIKKEGMVALGKVVFTSREHIIALEPRGKGLMGVTLRYPYEVRKETDYFDDIPDEKIPKDMLDLAGHIVESKAGHFDPNEFEDQYESALQALIKQKQSGKPIERPQEPKQSNVISLMDALRQSLKTESGSEKKKLPAATTTHKRAPARRPTRKKAS